MKLDRLIALQQLRRVGIVMTALTFGAPVTAQPNRSTAAHDHGYRGPEMVHASDGSDLEPDQFSSDAAVRMVQQVAECVAKDDARKARAFVTAAANVSLAQAGLTRAMQLCLPTVAEQMTINRVVLRDYLAVALVMRGFPYLPPAAPTANEPIQPWILDHVSQFQLYKTAACIAQTNPSTAQAVVVAQSGSELENQQIAALTPILQSCATPNTAFRATKRQMKMALATALVHRAYGPSPTVKEAAVMAGKAEH